MQHQYFVKGLGFTPKVDVLETRSYNRIRKVPYTAYNNRSYNINPRDIRQVSERLRSLVNILNKAVKNQAVTMFKYLSIYVQTKQQEETKAQLRVIQEALLQFQHAIQLYHQRQKCLVFFRLAKMDVMSQLKKQLKLPIQILRQTPITHSVFRKWLQITLESKCNRLLRQQKKNMNQFYMFMLRKLDSKQQSNMRWSFKRLQSTQYKHKITKMINNLSLCRIRMELKQVFTATMTFNQKPQTLLKLLVFHRIKQFSKSNNNQQYSIIVISNVIKKHAFKHQLQFYNVMRQSTQLQVQTGLFTLLIQLQQRLWEQHKVTAFQMLKQNLQSVKFHQFADIEQARHQALLRLEYKKLDQRAQLTQSRVDPTVGLKLMILLRTVLNKNLWIAHGHIKQCTQQYQQDEEVQLNVIKNMSVINAQLSRKIKAKGQKVNLMDRRIHMFKLLDRITQEERMSKKQALLAWQDSVSFPPQLYDDYVSRIRVLTKEKNVLIIDIEQLELMNNELQQNVNQVRHTFLSEESLKFGVEHNKVMDIQTFDIQENVASQEDLKIGFEYVNFLKEQNIDLREQYTANEKVMQEEQDQLSLDLEIGTAIIGLIRDLFILYFIQQWRISLMDVIQWVQLDLLFRYCWLQSHSLCLFVINVIYTDKRIREKPKRQWKVWGLDTSKQGCSQLIGHAFNVLLAIHMSGGDSDECVRYLSVLVLDTTIGVLICYVILKVAEMGLESLNLTNYCSGNYFLIIMPEDQVQKNEMNNQKVPTNTHLLKPIIKIDLKSWLYQLLIWVSIVCASKSFLYLIQLGMSSGLEATSGYILSPFENVPTLKLIVVMMCIPVIMNGVQFWIQDNFLKKTQFTTQEKRYVMSEMYVDERQASFAQLENYVNNPQDPKGSTHNLNLPLEMEVMQKKHNGYQKAELGDNE